jgi:hypothetical protein
MLLCAHWRLFSHFLKREMCALCSETIYLWSETIYLRSKTIYLCSETIYSFNRESTFLLNNQPDALINQIYSVIKLYMFRASSQPIISSLLYLRHW